jgi:hypothetical protein
VLLSRQRHPFSTVRNEEGKEAQRTFDCQGREGARTSGRFRVGMTQQLSYIEPFSTLKRHECRAPLWRRRFLALFPFHSSGLRKLP